MKVKDGVQLRDLQLEIRIVLKAAEIIWAQHGQELVVTSTADGVHSAGSLHPYGYAVDFRIDYFGAVVQDLVAHKLRAALPAGYQVYREATHIHIEFDDAKKKVPR